MDKIDLKEFLVWLQDNFTEYEDDSYFKSGEHPEDAIMTREQVVDLYFKEKYNE